MAGPKLASASGSSAQRPIDRPTPVAVDMADRVDFPGIWTLLLRHALLALSIIALGVGLSWNALSSQQRQYEATATIVLEPVTARLDPGQTQVRSALLSQSEINTEVDVMRSQDFVLRVAEDLGLFEDPDFGGAPNGGEAPDRVAAAEAIVPKLLSMYWLDFRPGTLTININVLDSDADRSALIANGLASAYSRHTIDVQQGGLRQRIEFLEQRLERVRENLTEAELDTAAFIRVHGLDNPQRQSDLVASLDRISAQIDIARRLGEPVGALDEEKAGINAALTQRSAAELTRLGLERQINRLNVREDLFSEQLDALQAQMEIVAPIARQVTLAVPPAEPLFPNVRTGLAGAGIGSAAIAFVAVLFAASFDTRIRETGRYAGALRLSPFGRLSRIPYRDRSTSGRLLERYSTDRKPSVGDTLRHVVTTVRRRRRRDGSFVLMITSAERGEGRSTIAVALATAEAQAGERVLLIDLDRPGHGASSLLGAQRSEHGFADLIKDPFLMWRELQDPTGPAGFSLCVPASEGFVPRSRLPERTDDARGVRQQRGTLGMLRARFDLIIIDVPPVLSDDTALRLASFADETLVVVRVHRTRRPALADAVSVLRSSTIEPCGTVENHG